MDTIFAHNYVNNFKFSLCRKALIKNSHIYIKINIKTNHNYIKS